MKNLYLSLSFTALAMVPAMEGSAQGVLRRPSATSHLTVKSQPTAARTGGHATAKVRWHQDSHGINTLRGGIANDQCSGATLLTVNAPGSCPGAAVAGDNAGADHDGSDPACDATTTAWEDVWYAFNSGTNTSVTISITQGTIEDILVELLEGGCGGTSIFCDYTALSYTIPVAAGTDYAIRIASNNDFGVGGTFDICLTGSGGGGGVSNDDCADVVPADLTVGGSVLFSGDNTGAVVGGDIVPGTGLDAGGDTTTVWHAFTITECANIIVAYCGTATLPAVYWASLALNCPADDNLIFFSDGNFTDCPDGNATIIFAEVPAGTYYLPVRGEPATAGPYSIEVSATACASAGPYCNASANSLQFEKMSNVTTAGINNSSAGTAGYEDFTGVTGNMTVGNSYPVSVTISGGYTTDQVLIWIDFDQSLTFEPGEQVFASALGVGPHTGNIAVPAGAANGATRMRVRLHDTYDLGVDYFNTPNPTPCDTSTFGQVEDYTVNIGGGVTPPNDDCTGAVVQNLAVGSTISFSGDNTGATEDGGTGFVIVWEAFTTTECANVTVNYCVAGSVFTDFLVNLAVNCPDFLTGVLTGANDPCTVTFAELPAGTYYVPVMVDAATTPVGPYTIEVSATACVVTPYCDASANSLQFEKISNVTISDINNNSASTAGYEDFTGVVGQVVGGVDYNISVTISGGYDTDQVLAWIDFDQNQVFDPSEGVFTSPLGVGPHTGTVTIPLTATQGPTRMRVRLHDTYDLGVDYFNTPNPTPCDTSTFGQVEDYTIDVIGVITGVNENAMSSFTVFPNPTNGDLNFAYGAGDAVTVIDVLDMTGRVVYSEQRQLLKGQQVHLALARTLASGTYALRLSSENGRGEQRFVVR